MREEVKILAASLNGSDYGCETDNAADMAFAKDKSMVVVYGYSDDCAELDGAVQDEISCYNGGAFWIDAKGRVSDTEKAGYKKVEAVWCGPSGASWEYQTDIPHETFNVYEDGELYCVGIVFCLNDIE